MQAKKTQRWEMVLLHEDIPCNLAPAHFMVHIAYAIKLRSRETRITSLSDLISASLDF